MRSLAVAATASFTSGYEGRQQLQGTLLKFFAHNILRRTETYHLFEGRCSVTSVLSIEGCGITN